MTDDRQPRRRPWPAKFGDSFRGIHYGVWGQASFAVHFIAATAVVAAAWWCRVSVVEWCLLTLCIALVTVSELFNSALEELARAVDTRPNPRIGRALDIASGAVLLSAVAAAVVGAIIFLPRIAAMLRP
jgi:diacylglycerol kinase